MTEMNFPSVSRDSRRVCSTGSLYARAALLCTLSVFGVTSCSQSQPPTTKPAAAKSGASKTTTTKTTTTKTPQTVSTQPNIGVGLEGLADWSRAMMFVDAMKTSRAWGKPQTPWEHTVKTDKFGWPTEDAGIVVIADTPGIGGTYKLEFEGKAEAKGASGGVTVTNLKFDEKTKKSTADVVVEENATNLMLSFTGTAGGVKNVRLLRPGYELSTRETFNKPFLERLKPFKTIRLMDFTSTNNNPVKTWSERTTKEFASQARAQGGAWEYVVELANLTGADIWINIPEQADDDYVRQLATMLKNELRSNQKIYVEWSNEVWNWQFGQAQHNLQAAKTEGKDAASKLDYDKSGNEGYWHMRRIAKRSMEVGQIFREVFGETETMNRIRPVYATQVGYEEVYKQGLMFIESQYGAPSKYFYGVAGAPYFNLIGDIDKKKDLTVDEIFENIPKGIEENLNAAEVLGSYARFYNIKLLAYEGGQHLQDHAGYGNADAKVEANRDPRMGQFMEKYLRGWNERGGDLFMYFTLTSGYSKWGSWGMVEDVTKTSPKYDAVMRVLAAPKAKPTAGALIPGDAKAGDFLAQSHWAKKGSETITVGKDNWFQYLLRAPKSGTYKLALKAKTGDENASAQILMGGEKVGEIKVPKSEDFAASPTTEIKLKAGLNAIRVLGSEGRFELQSLSVTQ